MLESPGPAASKETASHRRVLSRVALLGTATVGIKLMALAKDLLVARQLGAGDALDAYLVALVLPSYVAVILAHTFASAFVPTYIRLWRREGLPSAQQLAGGVLAVALAILAPLTLVLCLAAPLILPLVGSGFDASKLALTQRLFYPLAGIVITSGLAAVFAAILNAHERFVAAAVAPLAIPVATLAVFWWYQGDYGVQALAMGTALGFLVEMLFLLFAAWQARLLPWPRMHVPRAELSRVGSQYLPVAIGGVLMSSATVIDQAMAASLGSGQVSILNYGGKVVAVVLGIVAASALSHQYFWVDGF